MKPAYLAIDIGGSNTKYGFITKDGDILSSHKIKTNSKQSFDLFLQGLKLEVLKNFDPFASSCHLEAIGIGAPNANSTNGLMESPPNLAWDTVDLATEFANAFKMPVKIENDANVAAIGEKRFGLAQELNNFMVITLGTGVGTGTFINNELYLGGHGIGSEAGHMIVVPEGRMCSCRGKGHLEAYASATGIKNSVKEVLAKDLSFREINDLFQVDDLQINKIIQDTANKIAIALTNYSSVLSPEAFIFAGGVCVLGEKFRFMIEAEYKKLVYKPFAKNSKIYFSNIAGSDGAILGAAGLVM